jgi:hypothetical protein
MKIFTRRLNCIFDNSRLKKVYTFKKFPIFIGTTDQKISKDKFVDMDITCSKKNLIQLSTLINPNLLYSKFHSEAIGKTWKDHNRKFLFFLKKYSGQNILEIGSGPLKPYHSLIELSKFKKWISIEPSSSVKSHKVKKSKIKIIKGFIENIPIRKLKECDTLIHSHVIEHLFDPQNILKKVSKIDNLKKIIFSVPDLEYYVKQKYSNSLNFEHTYFINKKLIKYFLNNIGFKIIKTQNFKNHSTFYYAIKNKKIKLPLPNFKNSKINYLMMIKHYKNKVKKINKILDKHDGEVFIFGAHVFSQFLINFGLNIGQIKFVLDNSKLKQNQRLYGYDIYIKNPSYIKKAVNPLVIADVGMYKKEINSQLKNLNKSVKIIN